MMLNHVVESLSKDLKISIKVLLTILPDLLKPQLSSVNPELLKSEVIGSESKILQQDLR
jgi:hypothetical protein